MLLQARRDRSTSIDTKEILSTNPSGAAAPLDEEGYSTVADRCCQAEMQVFIQRQVVNLGMEVCEEAGLVGIAPYHSCEAGPQTFAKLTANILADIEKRCTWVARAGECKERPADCAEYPGLTLADCGCSRASASKVDFGAGTLSANNLGGVGPQAGAEEIRYANMGTSETGKAFDVVVTALGPYDPPKPEINGIKGEFGAINQRKGSTTDFKFSFVEPGTNTPVQLKEVHMALFDLDGNADQLESAASKGYKGYVTDTVPSLLASRLPDGRTQFSADGVTPNIPNPTTPDALNSLQRKGSVMYFYSGVSSFDLTFAISGTVADSGRNLFFAFQSALNNRCAA